MITKTELQKNFLKITLGSYTKKVLNSNFDGHLNIKFTILRNQSQNMPKSDNIKIPTTFKFKMNTFFIITVKLIVKTKTLRINDN